MYSKFIPFILISSAFLSACGASPKPKDSESSNAKAISLPYYDVNTEKTFDASLLTDLPKHVDFKDSMTPVRNQDSRGTCSFFGSIALVESAIKRKMNLEVNLSEEYLNYAVKSAGFMSVSEGSYPDDNLSLIFENKLGFLLEKDMPYQPNYFDPFGPCEDHNPKSHSAPKYCYSHYAPNAETLAKKLSSDDFSFEDLTPVSINDVIRNLAVNKSPLSVVIPTSADGPTNDGDANFSEEMRATCIKNPAPCGLHVVTITGYDLDKKVFYFKNSWGVEWGDKGYGTIPIDVIDRHSEHCFAKVELKENLNLPKDFNAENLVEIKNFKINSSQDKDNSIRIKLNMDTGLTSNVTQYVSTTLVESKEIDENLVNDSNAKIIQLVDGEYSSRNIDAITDKKIKWPTNISKTNDWNTDNNLEFILPKVDMNRSLIQKKIRSTNVYVRTTLYKVTDEGFKVLKRIYHPFNFSN